MATMSFTVPDEVRDKFEQAFRTHDQSAVVTGLLVLAVQAEERQRRRSLSLVERLRRVGGGPPADKWSTGTLKEDGASSDSD